MGYLWGGWGVLVLYLSRFAILQVDLPTYICSSLHCFPPSVNCGRNCSRSCNPDYIHSFLVMSYVHTDAFIYGKIYCHHAAKQNFLSVNSVALSVLFSIPRYSTKVMISRLYTATGCFTPSTRKKCVLLSFPNSASGNKSCKFKMLLNYTKKQNVLDMVVDVQPFCSLFQHRSIVSYWNSENIESEISWKMLYLHY